MVPGCLWPPAADRLYSWLAGSWSSPAATRAMTYSKSEARLRYVAQASETGLPDSRAATARRSARRTMVRARSRAAEADVAPGTINTDRQGWAAARCASVCLSDTTIPGDDT